MSISSARPATLTSLFNTPGFCGPLIVDDSRPLDPPWFSFLLENHEFAYASKPLVDRFSSRHIRRPRLNLLYNLVQFSSSNHQLIHTQTCNTTTNSYSVKHKNIAIDQRASTHEPKARKTKASILVSEQLKGWNLLEKKSKKTVA